MGITFQNGKGERGVFSTYVCQEASHNKFWHYCLNEGVNVRLDVAWGPIGDVMTLEPQKVFSTREAAANYIQGKIREKEKKGYSPAGGAYTEKIEAIRQSGGGISPLVPKKGDDRKVLLFKEDSILPEITDRSRVGAQDDYIAIS